MLDGKSTQVRKMSLDPRIYFKQWWMLFFLYAANAFEKGDLTYSVNNIQTYMYVAYWEKYFFWQCGKIIFHRNMRILF